jgi:norsolorinic acid ketoreductase
MVVVVKIESTAEADPAEVVKSNRAHGIAAINVVIANAGISGSYARVDAIDVGHMREIFEVNTPPLVSFFKIVNPLLQESKNPKFVAISTNGASIVDMEGHIPFIPGSSGVSKPVVNFLTRRIHFENEYLKAFVINPS